MSSRELCFRGSSGLAVRGDLHDAGSDAPLALVLHGFKGFRRWGFFPWLCERLRAGGISALRLDFSHNGYGERDFDRLDLFAIDTWTRHQEDLAGVAEVIGARGFALVGHSRGGTDALLFAAHEPRVRAVATLAAPSSTLIFPPDFLEVVEREGSYPVMNARTGMLMPVKRDVYDDAPRHDVLAAAAAFAPRPLLVIHGGDDLSVANVAAGEIARAHGLAERLLVEGADHGFGAVHPFAGPTEHLELVGDRLLTFLGAALG